MNTKEYHHILSPSGTVLSKEEFRKAIGYNSADDNGHRKYIEALKTGGYLNLKPYSEVVEFLVANKD